MPVEFRDYSMKVSAQDTANIEAAAEILAKDVHDLPESQQAYFCGVIQGVLMTLKSTKSA